MGTSERFAFIAGAMLFGCLFFVSHHKDNGAEMMNKCMGLLDRQEQEMCIGDMQYAQRVYDGSPDLSGYYK